jgi:hypothetical protein
MYCLYIDSMDISALIVRSWDAVQMPVLARSGHPSCLLALRGRHLLASYQRAKLSFDSYWLDRAVAFFEARTCKPKHILCSHLVQD